MRKVDVRMGEDYKLAHYDHPRWRCIGSHAGGSRSHQKPSLLMRAVDPETGKEGVEGWADQRVFGRDIAGPWAHYADAWAIKTARERGFEAARDVIVAAMREHGLVCRVDPIGDGKRLAIVVDFYVARELATILERG